MKHELKREHAGKAETGSITPTCSCGWRGRTEYAYNDYQHSNVKEQEGDHIRGAHREAMKTANVGRHTPGPWEVVAGDDYRIEAAAIPAEYPHLFPGDDLGRMVAMVGNRQPDFGAADAALISAAPDLLAALQKVVSISDRKHDAWDEAKAAIAKARGLTPNV